MNETVSPYSDVNDPLKEKARCESGFDQFVPVAFTIRLQNNRCVTQG